LFEEKRSAEASDADRRHGRSIKTPHACPWRADMAGANKLAPFHDSYPFVRSAHQSRANRRDHAKGVAAPSMTNGDGRLASTFSVVRRADRRPMPQAPAPSGPRNARGQSAHLAARASHRRVTMPCSVRAPAASVPIASARRHRCDGCGCAECLRKATLRRALGALARLVQDEEPGLRGGEARADSKEPAQAPSATKSRLPPRR
jgi:hypothetical protein